MRRALAVLLSISFLCGIHHDISHASEPKHEKKMSWIEEEEMYGDMELLALLAYAEAGNQGLRGMQLVCDVVMNRVDSPRFPNTVEEVIYQPGQFSVVTNGALEEAGWHITQDAFTDSQTEWDRDNRVNTGILYFNNDICEGKDRWWYLGHCFGY